MLGIGLAGALAVGVLVRDASVVGRALNRANDAARQARTAVVAGDVPTATERMRTSRSHLTSAVSVTRRPLWRLAERIPLGGDPFTVLGDVVDVADAAIGLGHDLTSAAPEVIGPSGRLRMTAVDGRLDLTPLLAARDALASARLGQLADATARLRAHGRSPLVPDLVENGRNDTLDLADQVLEEVGYARLLANALPPYLGVDAPRRYFLAMQNPAELRGTGGLIGFYAVVTVFRGRFEMTEPTSYEVLSPVREPIDRLAAIEAPADFEARYGNASASHFLANINLDPSVPTVAPRILDLYEAARGERLDGVIMVDPLALQDVLAEIGPVGVPDEIGDPRLPNPVPVRDLPRTLMIDAYDVLGGNTDARETYLRELATRAFERVFEGGWEAVPVTTRVARSALDGHIAVYSEDSEEQAALHQLGIAGDLAGPDGADWFGVSAVNAAGNKGDVFAGHSLAGEVALFAGPEGWIRTAEVLVEVDNQLPPSGHDLYILQSAPPGQGFRTGFDGPRGLNRTSFSVWMPLTAVPTSLDGDPVERTGVIDGRRAVDHTLEAASFETGSFATTWAGPVDVSHDGDAWTYRLHVHRQPKAMPDRVALRVVPPDGWRILAAQLTGGGGGDRVGFGPHGEQGPAPEIVVEDGVATVAGDVTRSLEVEVRMVPGGITTSAVPR